MPKKPLYHHSDNTARADIRTVTMRFEGELTRLWFPTTQVWSWDGGDAIVSAGRDGFTTTIRQGDEVTQVVGSLHDAMTKIGLDYHEFEISIPTLDSSSE